MNKCFILDFGSGNTCRNNWDIARKMIDEFENVIHDLEFQYESPFEGFIIKWQLFEKAGDNVPLNHDIFLKSYDYAGSYGIKTTASVFDYNSTEFLSQFDVPFIKLANRKELLPLADYIPDTIPIIKSISDMPESTWMKSQFPDRDLKLLACVSDYPANIKSYKGKFNRIALTGGISDHTMDWNLFMKYLPEVYECHYKLPESIGLDAGRFARTPQDLRKLFYEMS